MDLEVRFVLWDSGVYGFPGECFVGFRIWASDW